MYALGLVARWVHLTSSVFLVGASAMIVIAGPSDRSTARRWEHRVLCSARGLAVAALASGLVVLGVQTALFEGRAGAALELGAIVVRGTPEEVTTDPRVISSYLGGDVESIQRSGTRTAAPPAATATQTRRRPLVARDKST